jgi:muramoyltetrapeptide carboxypeptidase
LAAGAVIGIAAPASPPEQAEKIDEVIARLTGLGFTIKPGKYLRQRDGYLAGTDEERAEDINALFADPEVKAVFALRGGYGSCRILPLLDYALIRANPKPFLGYSDITAMHVAILEKSGLITFHGSNATSALEPGNKAGFEKVLMASSDPTRDSILFSWQDEINGVPIKTVVAGTVRGKLLGGNLTCLLRLLGTPYAPDFRDAILFLEDTGEKAYRVDGNFTHLRLTGVLSQIRGLILGQFDHPDAAEQIRIAACLQREGERIGVPCVSGAPIGHFPEQIVVPHGAQAELNAYDGRLSLI